MDVVGLWQMDRATCKFENASQKLFAETFTHIILVEKREKYENLIDQAFIKRWKYFRKKYNKSFVTTFFLGKIYRDSLHELQGSIV